MATNRKSKAKPKPLIGIAGNAKAAASKTGLSLAQVKAAKDAGCKAFHPSGRIDCDMLIEFVASHAEEVGIEEGSVNKHLEEALRVRVDRQTREVKLEKLRGELIFRRAVVSGCQAAMSILFTELDRLFLAELPGSVKGLDEMGIKKKAEDAVNELRKTLTAKFAAIGGTEDE